MWYKRFSGTKHHPRVIHSSLESETLVLVRTFLQCLQHTCPGLVSKPVEVDHPVQDGGHENRVTIVSCPCERAAT